jgi:hypothetical protein
MTPARWSELDEAQKNALFAERYEGWKRIGDKLWPPDVSDKERRRHWTHGISPPNYLHDAQALIALLEKHYTLCIHKDPVFGWGVQLDCYEMDGVWRAPTFNGAAMIALIRAKGGKVE